MWSLPRVVGVLVCRSDGDLKAAPTARGSGPMYTFSGEMPLGTVFSNFDLCRRSGAQVIPRLSAVRRYGCTETNTSNRRTGAGTLDGKHQ